jgi:hypothetical protein
MNLKFTVLLVLLTGLIGQSQEITDGLLINYEFDGTTSENINNYDASNFGATYGVDRFGNENAAVYFDGLDDYINLPNSSELKPDLPLPFSFFCEV